MFRKVNKLAESQDMHQVAYRSVMRELMRTRKIIEETKLPYSSHMVTHWLRLWEYSWAIVESGVDTRMHILDAGGTGTIFSYLLAREGCKVTTIDIDEAKVEDATCLSRRLKLDNIEHFGYSILEMPFAENTFDFVFSICVVEHIPRNKQALALAEFYRVLKPGGKLAITFDYVKGCEELSPDGFCSPESVFARLIKPANDLGLVVQGEHDYTTRDVKDVTRVDRKPVLYGSLLFQKPGKLELRHEHDIDLK